MSGTQLVVGSLKQPSREHGLFLYQGRRRRHLPLAKRNPFPSCSPIQEPHIQPNQILAQCYFGHIPLHRAIETWKRVFPGGANETTTVTWYPFSTLPYP
ncbi:hypothetical protein N656DRAFT_785294 [Canariomyces notabilis]|uniref:Uncharacterized protein n=1 Tax=Canariomyces notabilis TaxID=2074819 RepID=A0AAN6QHL9_9PEZI|nr:hypothetical protein N656DRAFT_785294 [Canariomyces arenarius]